MTQHITDWTGNGFREYTFLPKEGHDLNITEYSGCKIYHTIKIKYRYNDSVCRILAPLISDEVGLFAFNDNLDVDYNTPYGFKLSYQIKEQNTDNIILTLPYKGVLIYREGEDIPKPTPKTSTSYFYDSYRITREEAIDYPALEEDFDITAYGEEEYYYFKEFSRPDQDKTLEIYVQIEGTDEDGAAPWPSRISWERLGDFTIPAGPQYVHFYNKNLEEYTELKKDINKQTDYTSIANEISYYKENLLNKNEHLYGWYHSTKKISDQDELQQLYKTGISNDSQTQTRENNIFRSMYIYERVISKIKNDNTFSVIKKDKKVTINWEVYDTNTFNCFCIYKKGKDAGSEIRGNLIVDNIKKESSKLKYSITYTETSDDPQNYLYGVGYRWDDKTTIEFPVYEVFTVSWARAFFVGNSSSNFGNWIQVKPVNDKDINKYVFYYQRPEDNYNSWTRFKTFPEEGSSTIDFKKLVKFFNSNQGNEIDSTGKEITREEMAHMKYRIETFKGTQSTGTYDFESHPMIMGISWPN